jgi:probable phosphoglycerate mutase
MAMDFLAHRLIFLRHGETDWNVEGRLQGQHDIPLNGRGRDQAASAGRTARKYIAREGLTGLRYVASPLSRTRDTMELARGAMGLDPKDYALDDRLMELSFGSWEGLIWPQVKALDPAAAKAREGDKWLFQPPGGESYAMLADRLRPWLATVACDTVIVSHGGVARVLMAMIGGVPVSEAPLMDIHQGRVLIFQDGARRWL